MTVFSIGWTLVVSIGILLAFVGSIRFLLVQPDAAGWLHIDMEALAVKRGGCALFAMIALGALVLVVTIPVIGGQLGRAEVSPFPWDQFISEQQRHGFWDATLSVLSLLTFHLWAFLIPAHFYATYVAKKTARRPWYPYVINFLIGLLLSTPHNPIYSLINAIPAGGDY
jgi:hypothetical protein